MNKKHNLHIGKFLEDSEELATVKKYITIVREKADFNLLKYLYHLDNLEAGQLEQMNQVVETQHPAFKVKTRAFIDFPEVQRVTIKIKESTQLQELAYLGISTDPEKDVQLKVGGE